MKYLQQFVTTSLNVGGGIDDSQTTGIVLQSLNNVDATKPSVACVTWADPLDTSVAEWVSYTSINSTTNELQGVTRGGEGYSAKTHSNGAVVAFPLSKAHVNELNDALLVNHTAAGILKSGAQIDDTSADHQYVLGVSELTADRTITLPLLTAADEFVFKDHAQTLTNKTLTSPVLQGTVDGWIVATETWTYASADDPTFTFTIAGVDLTTKYYAGMKLKLTQTTAKYFIVTKVAFSTDTTVTIYGGTDYDLANAAITAPYYSTGKAPAGFPVDDSKWTVTLTDTSNRTQSSPTQNAWYNLGSLTISIPIGIWEVTFQVCANFAKSSTTAMDMYTSVSTAADSESDSSFTTRSYMAGASGNLEGMDIIYRSKILSLASKTAYYPIAKTSVASAGSITFLNGSSSLFLKARSVYL